MSILRYSGGKYKASKEIIKRFPTGLSRYVEPFAGSFAVGFASKHLFEIVHYNDYDLNVYTFFRTVKYEPELLIDFLNDILIVSNKKELFKNYKEYLRKSHNLPGHIRAAMYFFVNRCSFNGRGEYGGFSEYASRERFTQPSINKIRRYSKLLSDVTITDYDYQYLLDYGSDALLYIDPPYDIESNLYKGHEFFDHELLKSRLDKSTAKILISYNDNATIRELYKDYFIEEIQIQHSNSVKTELLIRNY